MRESYVRPVTRATEPKREWVAVWRFRAVAIVLLALAAAATVWLVNKVLYAAEQDPTAPRASVSVGAGAPGAPGGGRSFS